MRYRFQRFLVFITLFQLFSQSCGVLNDKNVEFPIQICDGNIVKYSEEQKEEIIQKFTKTFPLADSSEKTRIVPRIHSEHNCEPGDSLDKLDINDIHDIQPEKYDFEENYNSTFIEYKNKNVKLVINQREKMSPDHICVQPTISKNGSIETLDILTCLKPLFANCSIDRPCVRKCCGKDESWDFANSTCRKIRNEAWNWSPLFYEMTEDGDCVFKLESTGLEIQYEIGTPENCATSQDWNVIPGKNIPGIYALGRYRMLVDGSVLMNYENGTWIPLSRGSYCVDEIQIKHNDKKNKTKKAKVLLVCKYEYKLKGPKKPIPSLYVGILFSASAILFLIVIVYVAIWDRHSIYEWTVFFEVFSMIGMIVLVAVAHSVARDPSDGYYGSKKCIAMGVFSHYFFLATFFWLFVINFEIWWNFRSLTLKNKKSRKWVRLTMYQLVGWGCPAGIVFIGWLLDRVYGLQNDTIDCTSLILPNYGQLNCYISKRAQGPYLYYPIGVLLGFNLFFYILTFFKIRQYQQNSQQIKRNKSNGHSNPIVVFVRLFVVMGVSWIAEIMAWAVKAPSIPGKPPIYWIVFDYVTLVQAIAIFVIFICRAEILQKLTDKYPKLHYIFDPLCRLFGCPISPPLHGKNNGAGSVPRRRITSGTVSTPSERDRTKSTSLSPNNSFDEEMNSNDLKLNTLNNSHNAIESST